MFQKLTRPLILLHVEGTVLLLMAIMFYGWSGGNWWLFALLFLAPDLAMVGYLRGKELGAVIYNTFHIYLWPALLAAIGVLTGNWLLLQLSLIWFAHIGLDRMLGYGLKYPTDFKDTHFSRV